MYTLSNYSRLPRKLPFCTFGLLDFHGRRCIGLGTMRYGTRLFSCYSPLACVRAPLVENYPSVRMGFTRRFSFIAVHHLTQHGIVAYNPDTKPLKGHHKNSSKTQLDQEPGPRGGILNAVFNNGSVTRWGMSFSFYPTSGFLQSWHSVSYQSWQSSTKKNPCMCSSLVVRHSIWSTNALAC